MCTMYFIHVHTYMKMSLPFLYPAFRWSFGIVLWEIATFGELMYTPVYYACCSVLFILLLNSLSSPSLYVRRWPPIPLYWNSFTPPSPGERLPHGQTQQLLKWSVCVHTHTCKHTQTPIHNYTQYMHAHMHTYTHMCTLTHIHAHMHAHAHTHTHMHTHTHTRTRTHICNT